MDMAYVILLRTHFSIFSLNLNALVAISKGIWSVKLSSNIIFQFLPADAS